VREGYVKVELYIICFEEKTQTTLINKKEAHKNLAALKG